jgi:hypothetical protein
MRKVIVAVLVGMFMWPAVAGAVECSPGRSQYPSRISPALLPPYPNPPFRTFAGWDTGTPTYVIAGVRDESWTWYTELTATTSGVMVHGEHQASDTGFQAGAQADGHVNVCAHAAGQTVQQRL